MDTFEVFLCDLIKEDTNEAVPEIFLCLKDIITYIFPIILHHDERLRAKALYHFNPLKIQKAPCIDASVSVWNSGK